MSRSRRPFATLFVSAVIGLIGWSAVGDRAGAEPAYLMSTTYTSSATAPLHAGDTTTLDLTVTNLGDAPYPYDVVVQQYLPDGVKRAATPAGILCEAYRGTHGGSVIYRDFCRGTLAGPVEPGQSVSFSLPVKVSTAGDFLPLGETASGEPFVDPCCTGVFYPDIQVRELPVHVDPAIGPVELPDVQVGLRLDSKLSNLDAKASGSVVFSVTVQNNGKATATSVVLSNPLSAGLEPVAASAPGEPCQVSSLAITCNLGDLAPSARLNLSVTLRRTPAASGTVLTNTVSALEAGADAKPADNTTTVAFSVK